MIAVPALFLVIVAVALFSLGLMALITRPNLVKMIIGLEFLGKGVSLIFITGGFASGEVGISQAVVFTLIVIEAVVAGVGGRRARAGARVQVRRWPGRQSRPHHPCR